MQQTVAIVAISFLSIILIGSIVLTVSVAKLFSECQNSESYKCPVFKCDTEDDKCSYAPFRCLSLDPSSSTCSGDNKVCMDYDITQDMTTKTSVKK